MTNFIIIALSFLPYFEAKNTAANYAVNPSIFDSEKVEIRLPDLMRKMKCDFCEGNGEIKFEVPEYGQNKGRIGKAKQLTVKCAFCEGSGSVLAYEDPQAISRQVALDRREFTHNHQGLGDIPVGEAFVKNDDYAALDKEHKKLIQEFYGKPCKKCNWTGIIACKKCHGAGSLRCPQSNCKNGFSVTETTSSYTRKTSGGHSFSHRSGFSHRNRSSSTVHKDVNVELCRECQGLSKIPCHECQGKRALICTSCNGRGIK